MRYGHGGTAVADPAGGTLAGLGRAAAVALAAVGLLAIAGAVLAAGAINGDGAAIVALPPSDGAWTTAASFGPLAVERVARADHPGGHHADDGGRDELTVSVALTNRLGAAVPFSPGQFRLSHGAAGGSIAVVDPESPPGGLAPGEELRRRVSFLVPEGPARFTLLFDDLGGSAPLRVELGPIPSMEGE